MKEEQNQSSEGRSGESQPTNLLPCPFCGKDAALTNVRMANHTFRAGCYNEFCGVRPSTDYYGSRTQPSTAKEVIDAWNTRAEDTAALRQRIAELEDITKQCRTLLSTIPHIDSVDRQSLVMAAEITLTKSEKALGIEVEGEK